MNILWTVKKMDSALKFVLTYLKNGPISVKKYKFTSISDLLRLKQITFTYS